MSNKHDGDHIIIKPLQNPIPERYCTLLYISMVLQFGEQAGNLLSKMTLSMISHAKQMPKKMPIPLQSVLGVAEREKIY